MRQVTLVCGPPCAGKTTYVMQRAKPGDIVLDQDRIGTAAMNAGLKRVAAMQQGTAWVIRCAPQADQRHHLAEQLGATIVMINPSIEVLMERAKRRPQPRRAINAVRNWHRSYAQSPSPPVTASQGVTSRW